MERRFVQVLEDGFGEGRGAGGVQNLIAGCSDPCERGILPQGEDVQPSKDHVDDMIEQGVRGLG